MEKMVEDIIHHYPYPIANPYRTVIGLKGDDYGMDNTCLSEPTMVLEYILRTGESLARFLGIISLCEIFTLRENQGIEIPAAISADFKKNIKRPSFGIWLGWAREGFSFLKKMDADITIPELKDLFISDKEETEFKVSLDKILKLRNALSHHKVVLDTMEKKIKAVEISSHYLSSALAGLPFLKSAAFGYIQAIELTKKPRKEPEFVLKGKNLHGGSIEKVVVKTLAHYKETGSIVLRYSEDRYLNLFPFYLYDEETGAASDVFFYNGMDRNRLEYIGINPGGKFWVENRLPDKPASKDLDEDWLFSGNTRKPESEAILFCPDLFHEFDHILSLFNLESPI